MKIIPKEYRFLIRRFLLYYFKCFFGFKLNYLDSSIEDILDEYSFYFDFQDEWKNRT